ncbi:MAG: hypothetical protein ACI4R9_05935 [Kiritimatiellia bacterium]
MGAQDIICGARVVHLRELKTEIGKLKADNARLREENAALANHFDLALLAAEDLRTLPEGGRMVILDGWNLILGAQKEAHTPDELIAQAKAYLAGHPSDRMWIVFDGPRENAFNEGRLRVSYTGGAGAHRADRFIIDFIRMARYRGDLSKLEVRTHDKDFRKALSRLIR